MLLLPPRRLKNCKRRTKKFNKLWTRVVSSETGRAEFETLLTQVQNLSPAEQAQAFNVRAQEKGGKFSGKAGKAWAEAARAYADVITVQNALNTPPVATAPREETGAEIAFKESKRLFDEAAAGAGELVGERMLSYINEARQQLREVSDPDLLEETAADLIANFESFYDNDVAKSGLGQQTINDLVAVLRQPETTTATEAAAEVATSTADVGTLSSAELFDMRSTALADGRELAAQGKMDQARLAFGFADALLKDLESFPEGVNFNYDVARAYSKSFNDAYTRSFVSELLGTDKTGRQRIAPEMLKRVSKFRCCVLKHQTA